MEASTASVHPGALLDRLTQHVSILEIKGDSYRLVQSKAPKSS
ncbi:ATP-binding protein [Meridianimarinicoccus marinus]